MRFWTSSLTVVASLILVGGLSPLAWGSAQEQLTDKEAIVTCMLEQSTPADKTVMRDMIVAALQEDEPQLQRNLTLMGDVLVDLAVNKCSMSMTLMNEEDFGEVGELYGEKLGEALISAAFEKLK